MDPRDLERRAEIARRLKAARWLAGTVKPNNRGKVGYEVEALSAEDLADRDPLRENDITAHKIGAIERMERPTPPMELYALAEALELPADWFRSADPYEKPDPEELIARLLVAFGFKVTPPDEDADRKLEHAIEQATEHANSDLPHATPPAPTALPKRPRSRVKK